MSYGQATGEKKEREFSRNEGLIDYVMTQFTVFKFHGALLFFFFWPITEA